LRQNSFILYKEALLSILLRQISTYLLLTITSN